MTADPFRFAPDHVVLVTGAGTGIGLAVARAFDERGARVVLNGRDRDKLERAAATLSDRALVMPFDVTQLEETDDWVATIEAKAGIIRTLVNNAGRHQKKPAVEVSDAEFSDVLELNLSSSFALARAVAIRLIDSGLSGDIQFVSSMAALFGIPYVTAYTAAKSAVTGLAHQLAVEWGGHGIRVNAIAPGFIDTAMSRGALDNDPPRKARVLGRTPLGRLGAPEEIAKVSAFLSTQAASFVTGAVIPIDGGAHVGF
ncbi:MAG: SDR family NAD(P)-dependent oxidoreductase [Spirochaeta sp.]|jgi:NAD(P)-dependent dehydrogenase (short-subunit alcohol dehydrogenase family)|nr:SDR family NAD(P)-dependent oxidoreductase [Spirochaeta sp.]